MKRKIIIGFLTIFTTISLVACSGDAESSKSETTTNTEKTTQEETTKATDKSLSDLENYFLEKGIFSGDRTEKSAEMIGAISGVGYTDQVEIYEYDTSSDAYKKLVKTNTVELEGFDMTLTVSAVKGKFVLFCEDSANKDAAIATFNEFK